MKRAVIVLAATALMSGGCGHTAPSHDPFVGTWHVVGYGPGSGMAVSKVSSGYRVVFVARFKPEPGSSWLFSRRDSKELIRRPGQFLSLQIIKFNPTNGRLTWTENGATFQVFTKVSDSTAPPTPWPTASP
jgi:hypothetical protein